MNQTGSFIIYFKSEWRNHKGVILYGTSLYPLNSTLVYHCQAEKSEYICLIAAILYLIYIQLQTGACNIWKQFLSLEFHRSLLVIITALSPPGIQLTISPGPHPAQAPSSSAANSRDAQTNICHDAAHKLRRMISILLRFTTLSVFTSLTPTLVISWLQMLINHHNLKTANLISWCNAWILKCVKWGYC